MKKLMWGCLLLIVSGCSRPNIIETPLSRSQIYYGQPVASLYDNFGAPKKAAQYAYGVIEYTFITENVTEENFEKKLLYCNLLVYAQNNRVLDWTFEGNNCNVKEPDPKVIRYLDERREETPARITFDDD